MASWPPLSRDDLTDAAGSAGFDAVLPLLVRRLVAETGLGLTELDMPGGSGTAAGGFDGVVTAADETTFVPAGTSVWESSVATRAQTKADEDYGKRIAGPDGGATAGVSYVQVILAPWTKARTWAAQRSREGRWRQVRAYNLDRVHVWLDSAPATTAWLAGQLGKALPGVRAAEEWWTGTWLPAPTLHAALAEEPAFFAELVGYLYRRDDEDDTALEDAEQVVAEQRRFIAERALEALRSWRRCPGIGADGTVDLPLLKAWITDGRERRRADGRLRPGDGEIGQVLAFAPPDPDGLFPPHAVRDLLEELRSDRIETGLRNGILNRRGVTSRGLFDGGSQEWQLATSYREQAVVAGAWPRTRRLFHQIADWYESDARTEDQEAERRRRGLRE